MQHSKRSRPVVLLIHVCLLFALIVGPTSQTSKLADATQQTIILKLCNESREVFDVKELPHCSQWTIDYSAKQGGVWGSEVGGSLDEVIRKRDQTMEAARESDARYGTHLVDSYSRPSAPICHACRLYHELSSTSKEAVNNGMKTYSQMYAEIKSARDQLLNEEVVGRLRGERISLSAPGGVLSEYANALFDASRKLNRLGAFLGQTMDTNEHADDLLLASKEEQEAGRSLATAWNNLPRDIQRIIDGLPDTPKPLLAPPGASQSKPCANSDVPYHLSTCTEDCWKQVPDENNVIRNVQDQACEARMKACRAREAAKRCN